MRHGIRKQSSHKKNGSKRNPRSTSRECVSWRAHPYLYVRFTILRIEIRFVGKFMFVFMFMFRGHFLYSVDFLFHVECSMRQLSCSSIISYNITSITHNHYTDIYPFLNINSMRPDSLAQIISHRYVRLSLRLMRGGSRVSLSFSLYWLHPVSCVLVH